MKPTSHIEISRSALQSNFDFIRKLAGPNRQISHVVKGNAYGHSIGSYVPLAYELGARHFSVYSATEAERIDCCIDGDYTIMMMGTSCPDEIEWSIANDVEFFVYDLEQLRAAGEYSRKLEKPAIVHIELETGLNRTGFTKDYFPKLKEILAGYPNRFIIKGVCSHLAGAESIANFKRIKKQISNFDQYIKKLKKLGLEFPQRHLACSAAAIMYPKTMLEMLRVGIMQYGFWPSKEVQVSYQVNKKSEIDPLKRILSWKTYIAAIKEVKAGEFIGYGTSVLAETDMKLAVLPVGYANGYSRSLSNSGKVLVKGKRMDVTGTINMNLTMVDVTNVPGVQVMDEVVLIGEQGDLSISVASFSEMSNLLNYEMLARLPERIPKIIVD